MKDVPEGFYYSVSHSMTFGRDLQGKSFEKCEWHFFACNNPRSGEKRIEVSFTADSKDGLQQLVSSTFLK